MIGSDWVARGGLQLGVYIRTVFEAGSREVSSVQVTLPGAEALSQSLASLRQLDTSSLLEASRRLTQTLNAAAGAACGGDGPVCSAGAAGAAAAARADARSQLLGALKAGATLLESAEAAQSLALSARGLTARPDELNEDGALLAVQLMDGTMASASRFNVDAVALASVNTNTLAQLFSWHSMSTAALDGQVAASRRRGQAAAAETEARLAPRRRALQATAAALLDSLSSTSALSTAKALPGMSPTVLSVIPPGSTAGLRVMTQLVPSADLDANGLTLRDENQSLQVTLPPGLVSAAQAGGAFPSLSVMLASLSPALSPFPSGLGPAVGVEVRPAGNSTPLALYLPLAQPVVLQVIAPSHCFEPLVKGTLGPSVSLHLSPRL